MQQRKELDCFVAPLLAMTNERAELFPRHDARRHHGFEVLGTVAVLPALVGVSAGLLGGLPVVDLTAYGMVSAGVVAFALVATAVAARRTTRLATAVA